MTRGFALFAAVSIGSVVACRTARSPGSRPLTAATTRVKCIIDSTRLSLSTEGFGDTRATFAPTAIQSARMSLGALHEMIDDYRLSHGCRLPASLDALRASMPDSFADVPMDDFFQDDWGSRISYRQTGSGYELRSAGANRVLGDTDDIVVDVNLSADP